MPSGMWNSHQLADGRSHFIFFVSPLQIIFQDVEHNRTEQQQDISRQFPANKIIRIENFTNQRRELDEYA
jgi:hypothetical protein